MRYKLNSSNIAGIFLVHRMRDVHNGFYAVDHVRKLLVHGESFTPFSYWEFATELSEEPFSRSLHQSEDYVMQSWMPSVEQPCWSARR